MNSYYKFWVSITLAVYFLIPIWVDASVASSIAGSGVIWGFFVPWIIEMSDFFLTDWEFTMALDIGLSAQGYWLTPYVYFFFFIE